MILQTIKRDNTFKITQNIVLCYFGKYCLIQLSTLTDSKRRSSISHSHISIYPIDKRLVVLYWRQMITFLSTHQLTYMINNYHPQCNSLWEEDILCHTTLYVKLVFHSLVSVSTCIMMKYKYAEYKLLMYRPEHIV